MHKMYKETDSPPKVNRVLVRTSSGHVTPGDSPANHHIRELEELRAKIKVLKSRGSQSELKFQIRFMSLLELVRRFLSSLRKVQKTIDNPSELNKHKERLEKDKIELENYLKKHFKYLDKKRRQQLEQLQKHNEIRKKSTPAGPGGGEHIHSAEEAGPTESLEEEQLLQFKHTPRHAFLDPPPPAPEA